jgi:diguanylate cyclase (GGDEF)-like protein/PAS domain S-box-containing protein
MMKIHTNYQRPIKSALWVVLCFAFILAINWLLAPIAILESIANYIPLHTFLELLSIIVSAMIFGIFWANITNNKNSRNHLILACSFLGVAVLDLLHVLSFPGMPDLITPSSPEKTINFWLMARYLSALSVIVVSMFSWRTVATRLMHWIILIIVLLLVSILITIGLFYPSLLPSTFVEGQGLTSFKISSEYFSAAIYLLFSIKLFHSMHKQQSYDVVNLFIAVCLMSMSQIYFTLYSEMNDSNALLGHIYKVLAYGMVYKSFFISNIVKPYEELSKSRNLLSTIIEAIPMSICWKDSQSRYLGCNTQFAINAGVKSADEIIDKFDNELAWGEQAAKYQLNDQQVISSGVPKLSYEESYISPTGEFFWINKSKAPIHDKHNAVIGMVGVYEDITVRRNSQEKLRLAASVFTYAKESISITDADGLILDVNQAFTQITGYSREEAIGQNSRILHSGRQSASFYTDMWKAILNEGYWSGELWNKRKNGEVYIESKTISAVRDKDDNTTHYLALGNDITPMKQYQDQLEHIAHYDLLTDLPNRVLLADRLGQAMLHCKRDGKSLAVVFLDLDGFKAVNDTYGHDVGDELLIALSLRMKDALRESDSLARIGGDEFVAVLTDLAIVEDCKPVLERLLLAASEPATIGDVIFNVSASIGVTLYPQDNTDADLLMRHADQAMYAAKELGKNRYHFFDTAQDYAVKLQQINLDAIRYALDNHQFVLYYQPKVNMKTGTVIGVEALIRWRHPERGLLSPNEFLPAIENNPMSIEMGEWVIDSALTQIGQWQKMNLNLTVSTSVNIAAVQLQQKDFTQRLAALLAGHPDVEPRYLELEVLETSALDDVNHVSSTMQACIALGVNFALDDFGTGYSSLTYLRRLPAKLIKIDQSFIRDMLHDADDLAIVEGVITLAKSFKREVIAEGVESIEHGTALLKLGCDLAQGYGIARPMPAEDIPAWINEWKPDNAWKI